MVTKMVVEEMKTWRTLQKEIQGESWTEDSFVIVTADGAVPAPAAWASAIRVARKELQLPPVTFHDLRHTHATWLLESGVDLKTVSQRLGHSSITITADLYAHVTDSMQRAAMEKLDSMMQKNAPSERDL
ncbi:site-specific integrase [Alicyclobacillus sp. SO9]|nr:site-specific integrase [Alicyclobacillus sp. SO9]QQE78101.1 site-specific integrase [Alicyclobacillus sp. SO9]